MDGHENPSDNVMKVGGSTSRGLQKSLLRFLLLIFHTTREGEEPVSKLLQDKRLFKLLEVIDDEFAAKAEQAGCRHCGEAKLHRGDYPRKARGGPGWETRRSFNCSDNACRKRNTPASVRFLGRRVYAGVVVVLLSAMTHGVKPSRVERLKLVLGIDARTLKRWRAWWLDTFVKSGFWKGYRGRFVPPLDDDAVPFSLIVAHGGWKREGIVRLLKFLSPLGVSGGLEGLVM